MAHGICKCINIELESPLGLSEAFVESRRVRTRCGKLEAQIHMNRPDVYSNKSELLLQVFILLTVDIHLRARDPEKNLMSQKNIKR